MNKPHCTELAPDMRDMEKSTAKTGTADITDQWETTPMPTVF